MIGLHPLATRVRVPILLPVDLILFSGAVVISRGIVGRWLQQLGPATAPGRWRAESVLAGKRTKVVVIVVGPHTGAHLEFT